MRIALLIAIVLVTPYPIFATDKYHFQAEKSLVQIPLSFITNQGQMNPEVNFYVKGSDKTVYFSQFGITLTLSSGSNSSHGRWAVKLDFLNANPVKPKGLEKQAAVYNYFKGRRKDWSTQIPSYKKIVYENLWPGIDLHYFGTASKLKYEFVVSPGADPSKIKLAYRGVSQVLLKESGALNIQTPAGGFEDEKPFAYQVINNKRVEAPASYLLKNNCYGFNVKDYDPEKPLIIDPALLVFCGYVGGEDEDRGEAIALDDAGDIYITGYTESSETSFPVNGGPDSNFNGDRDAFVAKVSGSGSGLIYCGYIGGAGADGGSGIAVDKSGAVYVTGYTESPETSFPVIGGLDQTFNGERDAFVAKVNAAGTGLSYCGYVGGDDFDTSHGIALDNNGNAYITGVTRSSQGSFPLITGPDLTYNGSNDAFVAKVDPLGTGLVYCGYIGGSWSDEGFDIAVNDAGNAFITGLTYSKETNFPVTVGPDLTFNGDFYDYDAFVAKLNSSGTGLDYCGYIGGFQKEAGEGIVVDDEGNAYVTGWTASPEPYFPVKGGPGLTLTGSYDSYVAKVNPTGSELVYCGYIGGFSWDWGLDIALDKEKNVYIAGYTLSTHSTFPVFGGPDYTFNGDWDAFVAKVYASGKGIAYCGYIGGNSVDKAYGIAVDKQGDAYVIGETMSNQTTFPVKNGPDLTHNHDYDAFVAKVTSSPVFSSDTLFLSEQGGAVNFSLDAGLNKANRNYLILGGVTGTDPGFYLPGQLATVPLNWDVFTNIAINLSNTPLFSNFMGTLDATAKGSAQLNAAGPLPSGLVGLKMYFAYFLDWPWEFTSNPVEIEVVI